MNTVNPAATDFDAVVVGAGFAGIYSLQNLRTKGFKTRVYEAKLPAVSVVPGTGTVTRVPVVIFPACSTPTALMNNCSRSGNGKTNIPTRQIFWNMPIMSLTDLICAKTSSSTPASSALSLMKTRISGPLQRMLASLSRRGILSWRRAVYPPPISRNFPASTTTRAKPITPGDGHKSLWI